MRYDILSRKTPAAKAKWIVLGLSLKISLNLKRKDDGYVQTFIYSIVYLNKCSVSRTQQRKFAFGKRVTGQKLQNEVLLTEGRVTLVDAYLAGTVLLGLLLNTRLGWWWADPLAALVVVYYGIREAVHSLPESQGVKA
jgi:hypothetical protein